MRINAVIISILIISILTISCNTKETVPVELKSAIRSISTSSYEIVVDIKCGSESFPIVISNNSLFNILLQSRIVHNQEDYSNKIIKSIERNKSIELDVKDKEMIKSYAVTKNDTIESFLKNNHKAFINKYFENNWFKSENFSFQEEKAVIYYLFINKIYCRMDCVSGYILIANKID